MIVDNSIRIGDFSHCFKISKGTAYKHLIGTYQFMAPEIFEKSECSGTEDIYSLGITLYVLLTGGKLPYDYQNRKPQVRHKEDEINIVFMCDDLVNIIAKASAYDAIDRYQNIHEFRDALKTFYDNHKGSLNEQIPRKHFDSNEHIVFPENNWEHISTQVTMGIPLEDAEQKNEYDYASIALDELPNGTKQCEEVSNLSNDGDNRIDGIENEGTKLDSVQFVAIADKKCCGKL